MTHRFDDAVMGTGDMGLRALGEADVDTIAEACRDGQIQHWLPFPDPYTRDDAREFVTSIAVAQYESGDGIVRGIETEGCLGGLVDLKKTDWGLGLTEVGYWVAPWARGHGLAGRATRVLADWALMTQGIERVALYAAVGNVASRKAAAAAGFHREGIARSALAVRGQRSDAVVYSRIRSDLGQ